MRRIPVWVDAIIILVMLLVVLSVVVLVSDSDDDSRKVEVNFGGADCDSLRFMNNNPGSDFIAKALDEEIKERC